MTPVLQSEISQRGDDIDASVVVSEPRSKDATDTLASHILLWSFAAAVLLAIAGFAVVAIYLFRYLSVSVASFDADAMQQLQGMNLDTMQDILLARAGLWKFILQSCGIIAGVAFGFLGFALFLLGVKGDMDASFDDAAHKVQLTRMAPGSFVLLIAAILICLCSLNKVDLKFNPSQLADIGGGSVASPAPAMPDMNNIPPADLPAAPSVPKPEGSKP